MTRISHTAVLAALLALPPASFAAPDHAARKRPATAPAPSVAGFGTPASADQLARARGGSDTIVNDTRLDGVVSGNSATQVVTGANVIQTGSFANASGIPIVIQNSGANVLIQNATVIHLKFSAP